MATRRNGCIQFNKISYERERRKNESNNFPLLGQILLQFEFMIKNGFVFCNKNKFFFLSVNAHSTEQTHRQRQHT